MWTMSKTFIQALDEEEDLEDREHTDFTSKCGDCG